MEQLTRLLAKLATYNDSEEGRVLVEKAAQFAERCHEGFFRLDGSPYILHPIAVATILSEWQAPPEILAAALLHDVFKRQYSHVPSLTTLEANFTPSLISLVNDVASLGGWGPALIQASVEVSAEQVQESSLNGSEQFASSYWRVSGIGSETQESNLNSSERSSWAVVVLQRNPMAVVIKLADRLHNLRSYDALPDLLHHEGGKRFAAAILNIFAPFADRLGMWHVKKELEDGAFRIYNNERYTELNNYADAVLANVPIDEHVSNLEKVLQKHGMEVKVLKQLNHRFSIYRQQIAHIDREVPPTDIFSVVVVVKSKEEDCYRTLGVVHSTWRSLGEVYDNIATPRPNGYRTLYTRVSESSLGAFKVLIRTEAMHLVAEYGITAKWRGISEELLPRIDPLPERPRDHIMAITPKGDVKYLPKGATPIDFAYSIHQGIGHRCTQAWVNGSQAALEAPLPDGAVVDIIVSRGVAEPSRDWLQYVVTTTAREAIEKWTRQQIDVELLIEASDRVGLLKDVIDVISARGINILYLYAEVLAGSKASIRIRLRQIGKVELENLERDIKKLPQITHTQRQPLAEATDQAHPRSKTWSPIGNPYSLDPVAGSGFKGRKREVQGIVDRLRGRDRDSTLLIWGQQRIGKTSLLYHLERDALPSKTYLIVYVTLHAVLDQPIGYFLHHIVKQIEQKVQKEEVKAPQLRRMKREPISYFQWFIDRLEQAMGPQSLLIILDEFQGIGTIKEEGATRQDVFSSIRSIVQRGIAVNFLLCGGGMPERLLAQSGLKPLLAIVDSIKIGSLEREAARAVVTELDPSLRYDDQAVEKLLEVTRYHPCYLKYLCKELFIARTRQRITLADVERVIEQTMEWGPKLEGLINHFWAMDLQDSDLAHKNEKVLIAIARGADSSGWTTFDRIAEQTHPKIADGELPGLLANLTDYGSIDADRLNYRVQTPLLELWLQRCAH